MKNAGPKTVDAMLLSNIRMTTGGEKKYDCVIDLGHRKRWVGIGWVDEGKATKQDLLKYPVVVR